MDIQTLESRIRGALYGYAIGDAMGTTTEFLTKEEVKAKYGTVNNIVGGGAFKLAPGKGTDDTAMTLCVIDAIMHSGGSEEEMLDLCCKYFFHWLRTDGLGCGGCCYKAIKNNCYTFDHKKWLENTYEGKGMPKSMKSLGNGSLMRALPMALAGLSPEVNVKQGSLTHNNDECNGAIMIYHAIITSLLDNTDTYDILLKKYMGNLMEPSGLISNTFNNVMYYAATSRTFEESILGPVNDGGDADTIAAITGGITGCMFGFENIPSEWVDRLDTKTKEKLESFLNFLMKKYVQI